MLHPVYKFPKFVSRTMHDINDVILTNIPIQLASSADCVHVYMTPPYTGWCK